jgi:hypothetical protein
MAVLVGWMFVLIAAIVIRPQEPERLSGVEAEIAEHFT